MHTAVTIRHLFISRGHNFFGRHGQPAGQFLTESVQHVDCRAGQGLVGDRFFGYKPDYNGQVTFFAWETYQGVKAALGVDALRPDAFRRNVITEGMDLNALIGLRFTLGGVTFAGIGEAKPCHWMDAVVALGAEKWLRGRGGLRAKILTDGALHCGSAALVADELLALG